jgi:hypothetical protein
VRHQKHGLEARVTMKFSKAAMMNAKTRIPESMTDDQSPNAETMQLCTIRQPFFTGTAASTR